MRRAPYLLLPLLAACAATPAPPARPAAVVTDAAPLAEPPGPPELPHALQRPIPADTFDRVQIDLYAVPAIWIDSESRGSGQFGGTAEVETGAGYGVRFGMGDRKLNVGLLYQASWHDEQRTGGVAQFELLLLDLAWRVPLIEREQRVHFIGDLGFGGAWLELPGTFDNDKGGAVLLRAGVEYELSETFLLDLTVGAFGAGEIGNALGYGTQITLGGKLMF